MIWSSHHRHRMSADSHHFESFLSVPWLPDKKCVEIVVSFFVLSNWFNCISSRIMLLICHRLSKKVKSQWTHLMRNFYISTDVYICSECCCFCHDIIDRKSKLRTRSWSEFCTDVLLFREYQTSDDERKVCLHIFSNVPLILKSIREEKQSPGSESWTSFCSFVSQS